MLGNATMLTMLLAGAAMAGEPLVLLDPTVLPDQSLGFAQSVDLNLPPLPARAGHVPALACRAFVKAGGSGGCQWNLAVTVNGAPLGRTTANGTERLLGRTALVELSADGQTFGVFAGDKLMAMYAAEADQADAMTTDGLGATFVLDLSDVARGVDGNAVRFQSLFKGPMPEGLGALVVQDIRVGWLPRDKLPKPPKMTPRRGKVGAWVAKGGLRLGQATGGGFVLKAGDGPELLVETGLGMSHTAPSTLVAEDQARRAEVKVTKPTAKAPGFRMTATWPGLTLTRSLTVEGGLLRWRETWTNTGTANRGVPLRHRVFLREGDTRFHVGGSPDNVATASSPANPTLYLEPTEGPGGGYGVTAESDWWRLLLALRATGGRGEVYTNCLALAPGKALDLEMTITPAPPEAGYWGFINGLRKRWGAGKLAMERPMFWSWAKKPGLSDPLETIKASLGHLGPVAVVQDPWQRLQPDCYTVGDGRYPKLPEGAPRTVGKCPDLDVDAFLTFRHREPYWEQVTNETALLHQALPGAKVIHMTHPAMECVYKPLEDRWPIAADGIKTVAGQTFDDPGYSKAWVGDWMEKDWGVLYFVPRPGSAQMQAYLREAERAMDQAAADGMYSDEFSWAFMGRAYSRYDYSRWDGYSADLDEEGEVVRLKADGGAVTEACQQAMLKACASRGKFFLGNGGSCLRSVQNVPHHRFIEGGNGPAWYAQGHLSAVPLILGNMGDQTTAAGVFASVRKCLEYGSIYVPLACNLLLEGEDNFVSKLYPMTVQRIGPGYVVGEERVATTVSRAFSWPAGGGKVRLYQYDSAGTRVDAEATATVARGQKLNVMVPEGGMVVAEKR